MTVILLDTSLIPVLGGGGGGQLILLSALHLGVRKAFASRKGVSNPGKLKVEAGERVLLYARYFRDVLIF